MDVDTLPHPPTLAPTPVATSPTVHRKADPLAGQVLADGLRVSAPSDPLEREAEATASRVMRMQAPAKAGRAPAGELQRACASCDGKKDKAVHRKPASVQRAPAAIASQGGSGSALPDGVRADMEGRFGGQDFSGVRVHAGPQANTLARSYNARAFTMGSDIYFGQGEYSPSSKGGQHLLAHELTHVVQGGGAGVQRSSGKAKWPKKDKFNPDNLEKNTESGVARRVGVKIRLGGRRWEDEFDLINSARVRYGDGVATERILEKGAKVRVNFAAPRNLKDDQGATAEYIFFHMKGFGGGWIPASSLSSGVRKKVLKAIKNDGADARPEPGLRKLPSGEKLEEWRIRPAGQQPKRDSDLGKNIASRIVPNHKNQVGQKKGENMTEHQYFREMTDKPGDNARIVGKDNKDQFVPILMNLPSSEKPGNKKNDIASVQNDIARPGETFHVRKFGGRRLERTAPTFRLGEGRPRGSVSYLYGYVGGDYRRRGWVVKQGVERVTSAAPSDATTAPNSP